MGKKAKDDAEDGGGGDGDDGDAKPKFCSCAVGSGLRTKICCFFCCGDMFEAQTPGGGDDDDEDDEGACCTPKSWPENPNAPWNKGKCKDIYCIVIFVLFWLAAFAVAGVGFTLGSWRRVIYATDFAGQTCGTNDDATCPRGAECPENLLQRTNIAYPRLGADVLISMAMGFDTTDIQGSIKNLKLYGICLEECPQTGDYVCNYVGERESLYNKLQQKYPDVAKTKAAEWTHKQRSRAVNECYEELWSSPVGAVPAGLPGMSAMSNALLSTECVGVTENCWINPIETKKIMFRCIPKFWALTGTGKECLVPEKMGEEPACLSDANNCIATNNAAGCTACSDNRLPVAAANPGCITVKKTDTSKVDMPKGSEILFDIMSGIAGRLMKMMGDLMNSAYVVVLCGIFLSLALSWGWVIFLQYFVSFVVWSTVAVFYVSWAGGTVVLYIKGGILSVANAKAAAIWIEKNALKESGVDMGIEDALNTHGANITEPPLPSWMEATGPYVDYFGYGAYAATAGFFVVVVAGIALYKKIRVAIAIIREAAKALQAMPTLIFYPLVSLSLSAVIVAYWGIIQLFLMSAGKMTVGELSPNINATNLPPGAAEASSTSKKHENMDASKYLMVFHLFVTLWTLNTIKGVGLTVIATAISAWYFTKEIDWKHATFEEEKRYIQQMHDKPCWSTHKPCCPKLGVDHPLQPCTAQRCFFRLFGCTKCCFFFDNAASCRRKCKEKRELAAMEAALDDSDDDTSEDSDNVETANPLKTAAKGAAEASGEDEDEDSAIDAAKEKEEGDSEDSDEDSDLSDPVQVLCAENHGCAPALCGDCNPVDGSPCKVRQYFCQCNKGIDYDGDGEIDCAERLDVRPAPGCILYTLTCCCFCQLCHYCCMNPIAKDKCWKKGGCRYTIDWLREEACPRNTRPDIEVCLCLKGACRSATFHMGPIMIGAFLVAVIQTARVVLIYIEKQVKQAMGKKKSKIVEKIFAILQGIMWVFEQCMKFITRNTYIMVAMKDLGFARACASAVGLLVSNVFVLSMVKIFSVVVIILGKVIVITLSMALCLGWLQVDPMFSFDGPLPLNGTLFQTVVVGCLAFMVAEIFFYTFQMTIDTVLLCFCEDCYQNDGIPEHNAAIKSVIVGNAAKAPVAGSVIFMNGKKEFEEFDMLMKVAAWSLGDMKKAIASGNRMDAPGIPPVADMELVIYDRKAKSGFTPIESGKLAKSKIHVIFKRHFPVFLREKGTAFPEDQAGDEEGTFNHAMTQCLLRHGIKVKAPKKKKEKRKKDFEV